MGELKNRARTAKVSKLLTFSCVDGPGNRFVIFLQGCNYNCISCHNPHTINHCDHCAKCVPHCPSEAISIDKQSASQPVVWDAEKCSQCDQCIDICPSQASPKITEYSVVELIEMITQHAPFLSGITVTGGEATLQLPFIIELFKQIKADPKLVHLSCFVDSNGSLSEKGWGNILPYVDGAMIDIKAWQNDTHLWLVGRDNHKVFKSVNLLAQHNKLHEIRLLYIPGKTDLLTEIDSLAEYLNRLAPDIAIRLNAFQHHGVVGEALDWPKCTEEQMGQFQYQLKQKIRQPLLMPDLYV
jgi:pyruvate formate lyase activating enzyme